MQRYSLDKWELLIIKVVLNIGVLNTKTTYVELFGVDDGAPFDYFSKKRNAQGRLLAIDFYKKSPAFSGAFLGWMMGLEPTTLGTTNRCSNQLSYNHHLVIRLQR